MSKHPNPLDHRNADHTIHEIFLKRWSPRAMSGELISEEELKTLFEAARWAPSTYNEQEWRFLYAWQNSEHWSTFFELLAEPNQKWCHKASVLVVVLSHKVFERNSKPNPVHTFDSGSAFENLALQGGVMGLVIHGMAGFDRDKARTSLHVPEDYDVEAMIAIGKPGDPDELPENYREMDLNPSGRKKVEEFICEGPFGF